MNSAHIHLVLNHIPVLGIIFGLLVMAYGFIRKSDEVKQTALGLFVVAALLTIPVYLTGEPAEEIVEHLAGVSDAMIDPHEDWAFYALVLMEITGVLALVNLIFFRHSFAKKFLAVTTLSSLIAVGSILWTANLGGKIRHTEIGNDSTQTVNPEKQTETKKKTDDDDDH
ncbi:MAG: hypothetical protein KIS76_17615 [Pyrinomonadaceae bacterium]|nr:hypothetical protein [Pyrinomonadaceae bacterium]